MPLPTSFEGLGTPATMASFTFAMQRHLIPPPP